MDLELPTPDGRTVLGADAYWRLSGGDLLFVRGSSVYTSCYDPRSLDGIEQDALCALAAVRWARGASQTHADQQAGVNQETK